MSMRVSCPSCRIVCMVPPEHLGKVIRCPTCKQTFTVRSHGPAATSAPATFPTPAPLRLEVGSATSAGRVRDRNEDSFLVQHLTWSDLNENHQLALVIVADGMGGHAAGDQAAQLALRTIGTILVPLLTGALSIDHRLALIDAGATGVAHLDGAERCFHLLAEEQCDLFRR